MTDTEQTHRYPAQISFPGSSKVANWRPLLHWLMFIPHFVVAMVLGSVSFIVLVIIWFAILFTGRLPEGLANFQIMALRYQLRVYGFLVGMTEQYPPFSFDSVAEDPGDYSIQVSVQPQLKNRSRVKVFFRGFMIVPLGLFYTGYVAAYYLTGFIAWFGVLFTGRYPKVFRTFAKESFRFYTRYSVYFGLMTDEYPPFHGVE